jgi:hypothetical protein
MLGKAVRNIENNETVLIQQESMQRMHIVTDWIKALSGRSFETQSNKQQ